MFVSTKIVAELLNCSERTVQRHIADYKFRLENKANGGRPKYEIALESLPKEAQDRYWEQERIAQQAERAEAAKHKRGRKPKETQPAPQEEEVAFNEVFYSAPAWQQQEVNRRIGIIKQLPLPFTKKTYDLWVASAGRAIVADENGKCPSYTTVYRWNKAYEKGGKNALMTEYGNRRGASLVPDDAFAKFLSVYMTQGKASVAAAALVANGFLSEAHPEVALPSTESYRYRLMRDTEPTARYMAREGQARWNRKYGYFIQRDLTNLRAGAIAVGDHMQLDMQVRLEDGTTVDRPWLTAWVDMKSRKFLGWYFHADAPNSDDVFVSFREMVRRWGKPDAIYIDNGKDYRCKDFAGGRKIANVHPCQMHGDELNKCLGRAEELGIDVYLKERCLTSELGIEVQFAEPYNAQAKVIERHFQKHHNLFERLMPGYTGTNVAVRPEGLKDQVKGNKILTLEEAGQLLDRFITNVINKMPFGETARFKGMSPDEIWAVDCPNLRQVSPEALAVFCQRTLRGASIGRSGVRDNKLGVTYWNEMFATMQGKGIKVDIRRDINDYDHAWVYYADTDELICRADRTDDMKALVDTPTGKEELAAACARKKRVKKAVANLAKVENLPAGNIIKFAEAGVSAINAQRGYVEPEASNLIEVQPTPADRVDSRAHQQREWLKEATTDRDVLPAPPPPATAKRKIKKFFCED